MGAWAKSIAAVVLSVTNSHRMSRARATGGMNSVWRRVRMRPVIALLISFAALTAPASAAPHLKLNEQGYFAEPGLNVMSFSDYYPDGHQTGVTIIQHGVRVAANRSEE